MWLKLIIKSNFFIFQDRIITCLSCSKTTAADRYLALTISFDIHDYYMQINILLKVHGLTFVKLHKCQLTFVKLHKCRLTFVKLQCELSARESLPAPCRAWGKIYRRGKITFTAVYGHHILTHHHFNTIISISIVDNHQNSNDWSRNIIDIVISGLLLWLWRWRRLVKSARSKCQGWVSLHFVKMFKMWKVFFVQKSRNKKGHSVCSELNISNHVQGHGWTWLDWIELNVFHQEWGSSNEGEPCARH